MPTNCIVDKCHSPALIKAGRKISVFRAKENMLEIWRRVVPTANKRELTKSHVVCEFHFHEHDVEKTYRIIINGEVHELPKGKITLKEGAVPSIFPYVIEDELVYSKIVERKQSILVPSKQWTIVRRPEFVAWINWIKDVANSDRRIILYPDMKIQVFVFGNEWKENMEVKTVGDLNDLFEKVEKLFPCGSVGSYRSDNCLGCVKQKEANERGRRFVLCNVCAKLAIKIRRQKRRGTQLQKMKIKMELLQKNLRNSHEKYQRLLNKVQKLKS